MESHPVQTAVCLSTVLNGIAMSVEISASLRKVLAFRAAELSLKPAPLERTNALWSFLSCRSRRSSWKSCSSYNRNAVQIESRCTGRIPVLPVLRGMEEIVPVQEVVKLFPQERVQQRGIEHAPVPQFREEILEVKRCTHLNECNNGRSRRPCLRLQRISQCLRPWRKRRQLCIGTKPLRR